MLYLSREGSGTVKHMKKHQCTPETRAGYGCPSVDASYWSTTSEEYVKFGARLASERKRPEGTLDRILVRYKEAWNVLYPEDPAPLTTEGLPVDFLWDARFPCPKIPWLGDIPRKLGICDY